MPTGNKRNSRLPFDSTKIDAMLLSHAHIDHTGIIPVLGRALSRQIYCTGRDCPILP